MKYRFLSLIEDMLITVLNFVVVVSIWATLLWSLNQETDYVKMCLFILVPFAYYAVRKYVKHIALFTLIHLSVVFLFAWLVKEDMFQKVIDIIVLFGLSLHSFIIRLHRSEPGEKAMKPIAAGAFLILEMFLLSYLGLTDKVPGLFKLAVLFAVIFFPVYYIRKFTLADFYNKKIVEDVPTGKIFKTGAPYVGVLVVSYAVISLVCINEAIVNSAKNFLKKVIGNILYYVIRFIMLFSGKNDEPLEEVEALTPGENPLLSMLEEGHEPSKIVLIIEQIFMYAVLAFVVGALMFSLAKFVLELIRRFKGIDNRKFVDFSKDYKEEREIIKKDKKRNVKGERLSGYSGKIRKQFIKLVSKMPGEVEEYKRLTVRDFARLFDSSKQEDAYSFALLYEKARYSNKTVTKADVTMAKSLVEKLI